MIVLGIETSCDETAASVVGPDGVVSDVVYTQEVHQEYGGVVPELAGRAHADKIVSTVQTALSRAGIARPDAVAATAGPGLIGAVLVGLSFGKMAAAGWGVPFIGVNHLEGHLLSATLEKDGPAFPFLSLVVSGGHTSLYLAEEVGRYTVLGKTVDDAAGEAFDKVAKMLGLGYPGGPEIAKAARKGNSSRFTFPRPMTNKPGLNFSFSGLKTFVLNTINDLNQLNQQDIADVACAFEHAVVDTIRIKCERAMEQTGLDSLVIAGGVSANQHLRKILGIMTNTSGYKLYYPETNLCTDNGAMIAYAGYQRLVAGQTETLEIKVRPRWPLDELETM